MSKSASSDSDTPCLVKYHAPLPWLHRLQLSDAPTALSPTSLPSTGSPAMSPHGLFTSCWPRCSQGDSESARLVTRSMSLAQPEDGVQVDRDASSLWLVPSLLSVIGQEPGSSDMSGDVRHDLLTLFFISLDTAQHIMLRPINAARLSQFFTHIHKHDMKETEKRSAVNIPPEIAEHLALPCDHRVTPRTHTDQAVSSIVDVCSAVAGVAMPIPCESRTEVTVTLPGRRVCRWHCL